MADYRFRYEQSHDDFELRPEGAIIINKAYTLNIQDVLASTITLSHELPADVVPTVDQETGTVTFAFKIPRGIPGYTPYIDPTTKHWFINEVDTGIVAEGQDGTDGDDGVGITSIAFNADYTMTITLSDGSTYTSQSLKGEHGDDGYSPSIAVTSITGGHRVTVTDAQGSRYFDVMDGAGSGDMRAAVYDPAGGAKQVAFEDEVESIEEKIPPQASDTNQLADKSFVNSSIENVAAYYITKDAAGNPFATKAELTAATVFYSGGVVRTPTRNDYCVVLKDESKTISETGENPTTRYIYDNDTWSYQYIVNNSGLTAAQWSAVTSNITAFKVTSYDSHLTNANNPHSVNAGQVAYNPATLYADGRVGKALQGKAEKSTIADYTLLAASWSGASAPYTYTLSVTGVTASSAVEILPSSSITGEQLEMLQGANIQDGGQSAGSITLKAFGEKPTINLPIRVIVRGDM